MVIVFPHISDVKTTHRIPFIQIFQKKKKGNYLERRPSEGPEDLDLFSEQVSTNLGAHLQMTSCCQPMTPGCFF